MLDRHVFPVAPFTGAWIEMTILLSVTGGTTAVAPFTGAWIEMILRRRRGSLHQGSHPSRVRGLKFALELVTNTIVRGRTLHGCVD